MALLSDLLTLLVTPATSATFKPGSSTGAKIPVFLNRFPADQPDTCIALYESGGAAPVNILNGSTAYVRRPSVQVISRATSYATARANSETIWRQFNGIINTNLPTSAGSTTTTFYASITPNQDPIDLGRDAKDRNLISANFLIQKSQGA